MSVFDDFDDQASQLVGDLLNERVIFRPQRMKTHGSMTGGDREPDPTRRVVGDQDEVLEAIVTWRPTIVAVGTTDTQGSVVAADVTLDFDMDVFRDLLGAWNMPRKGDLFELTEEYEGNRFVEVQRDGDDGSARLILYCAAYQL